jgi:hypothetical protein
MMKQILLLGALSVAVLQVKAQTIILNETFTVPANNGSLPTGWVSPDSGRKWSSSFVGSGSLLAPMGFTGQTALSNVDTFNPEDLLISPQVSLPSGGASTLTYKIGVVTVGGQLPGNAHYAVYVLPAANTFTGSETPVLEEVVTVGDQAIIKTVSLASFAGQNIKLYFRHYNSPAMFLALDDVNITAPTVLGTSEMSKTIQIDIYPNPATDFITIKSKSEIISTHIYDAIGRKVGSQLKSDKVDVRNLLPGNYILNINTKEGKTSSKFIKKD